jgi:hypothetical protein
MEFGDKITFTLTYLRMGQDRQRPSGFGKDWWHYWKEVPSKHRSGIFLGYRTLQNGICEWEEFGAVFTQQETIKVALVCPSLKHNPVYVVIDSMREFPA